MQDSDIAEKLHLLCKRNLSGINQDHLKAEFEPQYDLKKHIFPVLKQLIHSKQLIVEQKDAKLIWKWADEQQKILLSGTNQLEGKIYTAIKEADTRGITLAELSQAVSQGQKTIQASLKSLIDKQIVRRVAGRSLDRKQLFVLANVKLSDEVTGGDLFNQQGDFDDEKAALMARAVMFHLREKALGAEKQFPSPDQAHKKFYASFSPICDVLSYVTTNCSKHGLDPSLLKQSTVVRVLDGLVLQCLVEKRCNSPAAVDPSTSNSSDCIPSSKKARLTATDSSINSMSFAWIRRGSDWRQAALFPCVICPVAADCCVGGRISPLCCVYLKQWLAF